MIILIITIGLILGFLFTFYIDNKFKVKKKNIIKYVIVMLLNSICLAMGYYIFKLGYDFYLYSIITSLMFIIILSDFKYYVILDLPLIIAVILIFILKLIYLTPIVAFKSLFSGVLLLLFMVLVKWLGDFFFKRESLGWGDIKLSFVIGLALNIRLGFVSLIIGSLIAFPYAIYTTIKEKEKEIPFGPFLIISLYFVNIFQNYINQIMAILFPF